MERMALSLNSIMDPTSITLSMIPCQLRTIQIAIIPALIIHPLRITITLQVPITQ